MLRKTFRFLGIVLVVLVAVFTLHVALTVRDTRQAEHQLRGFFETPLPQRAKLLRASVGEQRTLRQIVVGQLVEHVIPLQIYVDTGGDLDYWKPGDGVYGQALWGSELSPRDACRAVVAELGVEGRTCINKVAPCLEGVRQAGLADNDCRDLYESGYFLVAQAGGIELGPHAFGNMRFKRGVYVTFNYSRAGTPPRHPIGDPDDTVIQVIAEHI